MISFIKLEITLNIFLQVTVFKLLSHRSKSTPRLSSVAAMTGSLWANFMLCPWEWKWKSLILSDSLLPHGLYSPWNSPGQNTGVGSPSLLQRIFPIHRSNPGLLYCRQILYQLSQQGNPRILEWVAYPSSSRSSEPRNLIGVSCISGRFFTSWATRELCL